MTHRGLSPAFSFPGWEGRVFSSPEAHVSVRSEVPGCGEAEVLTLFTFLLCDGHLTLFRKVLIKKKKMTVRKSGVQQGELVHSQ